MSVIQNEMLYFLLVRMHLAMGNRTDLSWSLRHIGNSIINVLVACQRQE